MVFFVEKVKLIQKTIILIKKRGFVEKTKGEFGAVFANGSTKLSRKIDHNLDNRVFRVKL